MRVLPIVLGLAAPAFAQAPVFLSAAYPDDEVVDVAEPGDWTTDADTGGKSGDIREHAGVDWQAPFSLAE